MTHPQQTRDLVIEAMRVTGALGPACREVGVSRKTAYRWMSDDPAFREAIEDAREDALDNIEASLIRRGISGASDIAAFFILKRWRPEYRDTHKLDISGTVLHGHMDLNHLPTASKRDLLLRAANSIEQGDTPTDNVISDPPPSP